MTEVLPGGAAALGDLNVQEQQYLPSSCGMQQLMQKNIALYQRRLQGHEDLQPKHVWTYFAKGFVWSAAGQEASKILEHCDFSQPASYTSPRFKCEHRKLDALASLSDISYDELISQSAIGCSTKPF